MMQGAIEVPNENVTRDLLLVERAREWLLEDNQERSGE